MQLLDSMIQTQRLSEFVEKVVDLYNEEKKEDMLWDIWLHRVHDKSYPEFVEIVNSSNQAIPTTEETTGIVNDSISILSGFQPE